jgi:hypothetical protein
MLLGMIPSRMRTMTWPRKVTCVADSSVQRREEDDGLSSQSGSRVWLRRSEMCVSLDKLPAIPPFLFLIQYAGEFRVSTVLGLIHRSSFSFFFMNKRMRASITYKTFGLFRYSELGVH